MTTLCLEQMLKKLDEFDESMIVEFDFAGLSPTLLETRLDNYAHLVLGYASMSHKPSVGALCDTLRNALGGQFAGYTGGYYLATLQTPIYVGAWGRSTHTEIADLVQVKDRVIIVTRYASL